MNIFAEQFVCPQVHAAFVTSTRNCKAKQVYKLYLWTLAIIVFTIMAYVSELSGAKRMNRADDDKDRILINAVANGERAAIGSLYERHSKRVLLFIKRFVHDTSLAEDITNDVFVEVWQKAASYEGRSKVSSWILGMARFKALTAIRQRRASTSSNEVLDAIKDSADTPEVVAQKLDKSTSLKECVKALSPEHRVIVDLIYYHDKSIREVATILNIPENTVKTRSFHARKNLSVAMAERGLDRGWP